MRKFYALASFMIFAISVSAQSNYKPGYYITTTGDTTKGFINYREWNSNPEAVDFKADLKGERKRLTPEIVKGFGITGIESYRSFTGSVSSYNVNGNTARDTSAEVKTIFLKTLVSGERISLFRYEDDLKPRYFVSPGTIEPTELIFRTYRQADQVIDERTYRKQLATIAYRNSLLSDNMISLIQTSDYREGDLTKIAERINGKTADKAKLADAAKAVGFFAGIGANITTFKPDGGLKIAGAPTKTSAMPRVVAGIDIYANPHVQQLVLRVEAGVGLKRYATTYKTLQSPYDDIDFKFNQINLSLAPQVLYNLYNQPDFKFYLGVGLEAVMIKYTGTVFADTQTGVNPLVDEPFQYFKKSSFSGIVKAGVIISKKFELNVNYVTVSDVSSVSYFVMRQSGFQAGLNYHFN